MTKARFEIGKEERHVIEVDAKSSISKVQVWVDGREIASKLFMRREDDKSVRFPVGEREQHNIQLSFKWPFIGSARIEMYVDGALLGKT